ncbi:IBN_N [Nesidiocoris tenuis]|uniref:IBN_N n=1 Tax=Nesidiocoris tenuis TaxID=355587 RepID=A0ABN7A898_9HEMI|nr:IBN_N [Nesidiocoris tenuis]
MENILRKLLSMEKEVLDQGTVELKESLKRPDSVASLCNVLGSSEDADIRQYAAVILKKSFSKSTNWDHIPGDTRRQIKAGLLDTLIKEPEKMVKSSIAQVIGTLLEYEMPDNKWPELTNFLQQTTTSNNVNDQELGFFTLSVLLDVSPMEFLNHAKSFAVLFGTTLNAQTDKASHVSSLVVTCMSHFSHATKNDPELSNMYSAMLPLVMEVIKALSVKRPDAALEALDFFYEYSAKDGLPVLVPHIKTLVHFFLSLCSDASTKEEIKIKALGFLNVLAKARAKSFVKNNLLPVVLSALFELLCVKPEDDDDEEYFTPDPDEDTVLTCACETLDNLFMNVDAKKILSPAMEFVRSAVVSQNQYHKKAGYLTLGIASQGAQTYIRRNCLPDFVSLVEQGVADPHPVVRAAALFALGQYAEFLLPEIGTYASTLLPLLIAQLNELSQVGKNGDRFGKRGERLFYATERFVENLETELAPYTEQLVTACLPFLSPPYHPDIRQLAMSLIGTIAASVKDDIMPYFPNIMSQLNPYLTSKAEGDDVCLQVEALETLSCLAKNVGEDNFRPLALESLQLGLSLIQSTDEPDIKKGCYSLFSAVSYVLKDDMSNVLQQIMPYFIKSLQEDEDTEQPDKDDAAHNVFGNVGTEEVECDDDDDDDDDEDFADDISVENDFIEEKEQACLSISELASNTGQAFFPYLETTITEVYKLLAYRCSDVRKAALDAAFQLCVSLAKFTENDGPQGNEKLGNVVTGLVMKAAELVVQDDDSDVVLAALEGFQVICKEIGSRLKGWNSIRDLLIKTVKEVLENQTEVQGWGDEEDEDVDEDVADFAASVIPALANLMEPNEFSELFSNMLGLLESRIKAKEEDDDEEDGSSKATMLGVIAESISGLGPNVQQFIPKLFPYLLKETGNEDPDIRNNALYCIGEMAYHSKEAMIPNYPAVLSMLSQVLASEKATNVMDNACGLLARMLIVHPESLPLAQILPAFVAQLPLKEDFTEDKWVFRALGRLYQLQVEYLIPHNVHIVKAALTSVDMHSPDEETLEVLRTFVTMMIAAFPDDCNVALSQLPPNVVAKLNVLNVNAV